PGTLVIGWWQIVALASAVLSGAAVATIREVRRTDGSWEIFLAFCVGGAAMTLVPTIAAWRTPTALEWVELVVVGLLSLAAQLMMTYSLRFVRAAASGVIIQLTPVAAMAIGWLFLGETMAGWAIVGALLTLSGVTWGILFAGAPEPVALEEP
ncbi:MAG TPA: EamA family transporter, partial [Polyangiaceae bacterium]|nr:EamA family transporter [Polyangiaceae bacterium]